MFSTPPTTAVRNYQNSSPETAVEEVFNEVCILYFTLLIIRIAVIRIVNIYQISSIPIKLL